MLETKSGAGEGTRTPASSLGSRYAIENKPRRGNLWVTASVSERSRPGTGGTSCRWSQRIAADLRLRDRGVVLRRTRSSEGGRDPRPSFSEQDHCGGRG